jgi:hypothetical protein
MILLRIRKRWRKSRAWLRGWWAVHVLLPLHRLRRKPIVDITAFQRFIPFVERREYSQNGEDGIIEAITGMVGVTNRFCVEFGVEDGLQSNTRYLVQKKHWTGLWMDGGEYPPELKVMREFITAENIEDLFRKYNVPESFDLLSIDIDGNDYWVWKAITHFHPRIVIVEYNAHIPPGESKTIPYDPAFVWDKTDYYGASLLALKKLGESKGYSLLGTDRHGVNAFFVETSLIAGRFAPPPWPHVFHPPAFKGKPGLCHPRDPKERAWVTV